MLTAEVYGKLMMTARWYVQDDAHDAVQHTIAYFYLAGKFDAVKGASLTTYLTKKLIWHCLDILKYRKVLQCVTVPLDDYADKTPEDSVDPVARVHVRLDVQAALRDLPVMTRRVVVSRLVSGHTQQETARELGMSPRSVARHLQAGQDCLRERLAAYNDGLERCRLRKQKYSGTK